MPREQEPTVQLETAKCIMWPNCSAQEAPDQGTAGSDWQEAERETGIRNGMVPTGDGKSSSLSWAGLRMLFERIPWES